MFRNKAVFLIQHAEASKEWSKRYLRQWQDALSGFEVQSRKITDSNSDRLYTEWVTGNCRSDILVQDHLSTFTLSCNECWSVRRTTTRSPPVWRLVKSNLSLTASFVFWRTCFFIGRVISYLILGAFLRRIGSFCQFKAGWTLFLSPTVHFFCQKQHRPLFNSTCEHTPEKHERLVLISGRLWTQTKQKSRLNSHLQKEAGKTVCSWLGLKIPKKKDYK